ncbi:multicopper oxidase domain-containing protein [Nocardioides panacis]|uniref:Multicopper oxidase domain-containing protein n=1 Tax=Nocardioides panacis TaxID=2849501 RepID=A0A975Y0Q2_9ACTN|nr:multicopper oxidase domain-containing protein [Nocardioides panacis]QWZ08706.1 multicopper oxidase domain-containing protein [Nocardioides panacis]
MTLSRRDLIKIAVAGGAAMAIPLERSAFTATTATRMPTSKLPKYFSLPFLRPPELSPVGTAEIGCWDGMTRSYPRYEVAQTFTVSEILPGYKTPVFGYNGVAPGPTIRVLHDNPVIVNQTNLLQRPPAAPYQSAKAPLAVHLRPAPTVDLDPPARLLVAAAVRRVRLRRHLPR